MSIDRPYIVHYSPQNGSLQGSTQYFASEEQRNKDIADRLDNYRRNGCTQVNVTVGHMTEVDKYNLKWQKQIPEEIQPPTPPAPALEV